MMTRDLVGKALDLFRFRKRDYQLTFTSPSGQNVLRDLAVFCRANENAAVPGNRDATMILVGRREVWLLIQKQLHLTSEELFALYGGKTIQRLAQHAQQESDNG